MIIRNQSQNSKSPDNEIRLWLRKIENIHFIIRVIIISSWIFLAGIFCYIMVVDYGTSKLAEPLTEIHWNIAIALFIIIMGSSFILQTILIEIENTNDLRNKIINALNHERRTYIKKRHNQQQQHICGDIGQNFNSKQIEKIDNNESDNKIKDIVKFFGEENSYFLYQLYRKILNKFSESERKSFDSQYPNQIVQGNKNNSLFDSENKSYVIHELCEFHIPEPILDNFVKAKIEHDGLAFNSYVLPLSFFLFIYFAGFLIMLPLINSLFDGGSNGGNHHFIPLMSLFDTTGIQIKGIPLLIIQWGFMGGFIYTSIGLLNRYLRKDLPPRTYYYASFKILFSGVAAVIVFLLFSIGTANANSDIKEPTPSYTALLVAFSIGLAPFQFLIMSANTLLSRYFRFWRHDDTAGKRSLTNIEGIDLLTAQRLSEEGLDYVQQLAVCDPLDLSFKTKYPLSTVKDWKDLSILYLLTADIEITNKDIQGNIHTQFLYRSLGRNYGIKRFSQFYAVTNKLIQDKNNVDTNNHILGDNDSLKDFCRGLGFTDSDIFKVKYIVDTIRNTGHILSEISYRNESISSHIE